MRLARRGQCVDWWRVTRDLSGNWSCCANACKATAVRVQRGDGVAALRECAPASMQLLLIDPPFDGAVCARRCRPQPRPWRPTASFTWRRPAPGRMPS